MFVQCVHYVVMRMLHSSNTQGRGEETTAALTYLPVRISRPVPLFGNAITSRTLAVSHNTVTSLLQHCDSALQYSYEREKTHPTDRSQRQFHRAVDIRNEAPLADEKSGQSALRPTESHIMVTFTRIAEERTWCCSAYLQYIFQDRHLHCC